MIKICPKCNNTFDDLNKPRKFCSRKCSNSRNFSEETRKLKSKKQLEYLGSLADEERAKLFEKIRTSSHTSLNRKKYYEERKIEYQRRIDEMKKTKPFNEWPISIKRKHILEEQDYKCDECTVTEIWNGKPLKLELDHIDGNKENNDRENLRFLCPNCHSQTETFRGKNTLQGWKGYKVTDEEIIKVLKESKSFYAALKTLKLSTHGYNYNRLRRLAENNQINL